MSARTPVTFTLDLEDHRPSAEHELRYPMLTREVLDFLDARRARGTFFVVGEVAVEQPALVREIASRGHEVGLHGWQHVPLTELAPREFARHIADGKARLEAITGQGVVGFRAPIFSLVPSSRWAVESLLDAGFRYSSSVLPAANPLFGDPSLPRSPFRWANGLLELPCPVTGIGRLGLPYLGGVYLRALPSAASSMAGALTGTRTLPWIYCHPYDFDADEPFWVVPEAGPLGSRLLWYGRRRAFAKVERALRPAPGPPLGERLDEAAHLADASPVPDLEPLP